MSLAKSRPGFNLLPENKLDRALVLEFVRNSNSYYDDPSVLSQVPRRFYTDSEIVDAAVDRNEKSLKDVPDSMKTYRLCFRSVRRDGKLLSIVPAVWRDEEMCRAAAANSPKAVNYIPDLHLAKEMAIASLRERASSFDMFYSAKAVDREVVEMALRGDSANLQYLIAEEDGTVVLTKQAAAKDLLPYATCLRLVKGQGTLLQWVPWNMRDCAMSAGALERNNLAREFVPERLFLQGVCHERDLALAASIR
jgi:hypothetical protein